MGLDMYAWVRDTDPKEGEPPKNEELHYWRKHNALHYWMECEWRDRGNEGKFNTVEMELNLDDLDRLETDIKSRSLQPASGFFFGSTEYSEEDWARCEKDDLFFIEKAREEIAKGRHVYYDSWW